MQKTVLIFGLIAGSIVSAVMLTAVALCSDTAHMEYGMIIGYTSMIVAFSFVFVGTKNYRDKYNQGIISFGKAFQVGILISLVASTLYVVSWLIDFYVFIPDFMDVYEAQALTKARADGATEAEIAKQVSDMATYKEMYKSPFGVILLTYIEILPVALLATLISSFSLKRKVKTETV